MATKFLCAEEQKMSESRDGQLHGSRIALTGARGRLAPILAGSLRNAGADVDMHSRVEGGGFQGLEALGLNHPDVIIHCAWSSVPLTAEQNPGSFFEYDLPVLEHVVSRTKDLGCRLVFLSSGAVYGNTGDVPAIEEHALNPLGAYARAKAEAEKFLRAECPSQTLILRTTNLLGTKVSVASPQGVLPRIVRAALNGSEFSVWGDGTGVKDYLDVRDFSSSVIRLLQLEETGVYNLGSGRSYALLELIDAVERRLGAPVKKLHLPGYSWDVSHSCISVAKLEALGWKAGVSLDESVDTCVRAMQ